MAESSTSPGGPEEILDQLDSVRTMLAADGYELRADDPVADGLRLRIVAGPDACEDCLVQKDLMAALIADSLDNRIPASRIELRYPGE